VTVTAAVSEHTPFVQTNLYTPPIGKSVMVVVGEEVVLIVTAPGLFA
jgi:hypothetical protein